MSGSEGEAQVKQVEANTGTVLRANLEKAGEVLGRLNTQIQAAGSIAEDGQRRINELIEYINGKYQGIEADKLKVYDFPLSSFTDWTISSQSWNPDARTRSVITRQSSRAL